MDSDHNRSPPDRYTVYSLPNTEYLLLTQPKATFLFLTRSNYYGNNLCLPWRLCRSRR